jgi:hypothetical protein
MNHDEHPDDSTLTRELRDSLSELAVPARPPLTAITSRGRVHQRRRLAGFASLGIAGAAAGVALALGMTGVLGGAPARGTGAIRTAAFTLTSNANGTVSLNLRQLFDPAALQRALARDGIPALVTADAYCSSSPAAPGPVRAGVLSARAPAGVRRRAAPGRAGRGIVESALFPVKPSDLAPSVAGELTMVINPAAMPAGTELFVGYFNSEDTLMFDLIYTSSHTCSHAQQPPAIP